ncbi:MAG: 1,4-alpha-glucan branching protein [Anaerococcus sp.]|nr:1,4-alpha-glucan branching protein [Peptoniphilaceae bacterium]MDY3055934.1 1,4-alpha-glucan branching protein [Anaerococcus sp.]
MNTRKYLQGESSQGYKFFGAHKRKEGDYIFRILAPQAKNVYLAGDFNSWEKEPARKYSTGVFSIRNDKAKENDRYCYYIEDKDSNEVQKLDPFGAQVDPSLSYSIIADTAYKYTYKKPKLDNLNIFQVNLASYLDSYNKEIDIIKEGQKLISYVKENNFTHIELMPIVQTRLLDSLGYRPINLISLDNSLALVKEFKEFIDLCHKNKLGIIFDFDLSEFDDFYQGLRDFDGTRLYESDYDDIRYNYFSGMNFDYSKNLVKSYVLSSLEYWIKEYNIDLVKFSNLEKLIYWQGDLSRGINKNSYNFIKVLNKKIHDLRIKSIGSSNASKNIIDKELGFDYIEDKSISKLIKVFQKEPFYRNNYRKTIEDLIREDMDGKILGMTYIDSVLEACSPAMKMYGDNEKYDQYKTLISLIYTLKSNKIIFSGQEIGDLQKWEVGITKKEKLNSNEKDFAKFFKSLTSLYTKTKALSHKDSQIKILDIEGYSVFAYKRSYKNEEFLILLNLTDIDYSIDLGKTYWIILDSKKPQGKKSQYQFIEHAKLSKFSSMILKKK